MNSNSKSIKKDWSSGFLVLLGLVFFLFASGCRKDKKQIQGSWQVERVTIAGSDMTSEWRKNVYTETYGENGDYSFTGDPLGNSGTGKYSWDGKKLIKRNGVSNQESRDLTVLTLTNDEFEYSTKVNGAEAEFKFSKK